MTRRPTPPASSAASALGSKLAQYAYSPSSSPSRARQPSPGPGPTSSATANKRQRLVGGRSDKAKKRPRPMPATDSEESGNGWRPPVIAIPTEGDVQAEQDRELNYPQLDSEEPVQRGLERESDEDVERPLRASAPAPVSTPVQQTHSAVKIEEGAEAQPSTRTGRFALNYANNTDHADDNDDSSSLSDGSDGSGSSDSHSGDNADSRSSGSGPQASRGNLNNRGGSKAHGWHRPRKYADPVTGAYAHINGVPDYLRSDLDVVFIGINPGKRSGTSGHFFAHPTNKFWRALHGSGFSTRLLTPDEDSTLLDRRVGLTNLVDRVTAQAAELSVMEKRLAVGRLARKLVTHSPHVACFVGKGIWDDFSFVVNRALKEQAKRSRPTTPPHKAQPVVVVEYTLSNGAVTPSKPVAGPSNEAASGPDDGARGGERDKEEKEVAELNSDNDDALVKMEPMELAPPSPSPVTRTTRSARTSVKIEPGHKAEPVPRGKGKGGAKPAPKSAAAGKTAYDAPQLLRLISPAGNTYLWVVPNTSGLERTTVNQHVVYFSKLKEFSACLRRGEEPQGVFIDVDVAEVERVVQKMQEEQVGRVRTRT